MGNEFKIIVPLILPDHCTMFGMAHPNAGGLTGLPVQMIIRDSRIAISALVGATLVVALMALRLSRAPTRGAPTIQMTHGCD